MLTMLRVFQAPQDHCTMTLLDQTLVCPSVFLPVPVSLSLSKFSLAHLCDYIILFV